MNAPPEPAATVAWPLPSGRRVHVTSSHLFPVTPYSTFLLEHLPPVEGKDVLDFGAGSGIVGVVAACRGAASVLSCDVSLDALSLTALNATRNGASQLRTLRVVPDREQERIPRECVDVVLCNPASLPVLVETDAFWSGGPLGDRMILTLIDVAAHALRADGVLRFVHTSLAALSNSLAHLTRHRFSAAIRQVTRVPFRSHYEPFVDYFATLRQQGHISFDGSTMANAYEHLYLISACRFSSPSHTEADHR
jgi:methylase of polypeptide subunit release factors